MNADSSQQGTEGADVRRLGEQKIVGQEETLALLEELRIHQVELETQNDELRQVQAELEASRARYFDLYDLAPVGYLTVDEKGVVLQANLRAAILLATDRSTLVHKHFAQFIGPAGQDDYYLARRHLLEGGTPQVCVFQMLRLDKSRFWARLEISLAREDGAPVCRIVIVDITERQQLEMALRANAKLAAEKQAAEDGTRAKSLFLSAMSHEIRTPLNGVIGMTGLLLQTDLSSEQLGYARIVADSAEALLGLVNNILDFSKIEAGKFELDEVAFNLEGMIEDVLDLMSFKAREKSLELACWYPAGAARCFLGDPVRVRQILMNLLSNAIKFTQKGHVFVQVEAADPVDGRSLVRIAIQDTGIGISQASQGRLFVNFNQADASIARRFGGTGLGLAIARQIVNAMGGEIGVTSREGEGSTFYCTLPLKVDWQQTRPPADNTSLAGVPVLICGEPQMGRHMIAGWCERWGMQVAQCDLEDLGQPLHLPAGGNGAPWLVVVGGNCQALAAVASWHAGLTGERPKLLLLTAERLEKIRGLAADAVLAMPVRANVFAEKLGELLRKEPKHTAVRQFATQRPGTPAQNGAGRILVADDNLINQRLACALLVRLGCQVDTADNGAEAVEKVGLGGYELVFMDCVMPEMDGFEATSAIRRLAGKCAGVPIVALTASATTEDRDKCLAVGMNDFLAKPVRSEQLAGAIGKWLKK